jgi:hypothetical protein
VPGFFFHKEASKQEERKELLILPKGIFSNVQKCHMEELTILTCVVSAKNCQLREENTKFFFYRNNSIPNTCAS